MDRENLENQLIDLLRQLDENPDQAARYDDAVDMDEDALNDFKEAQECLDYLGQVRDLCHRESVSLRHDSTIRPTEQIRKDSTQLLPRHIGRFQVIESLGTGGFGNVYLALDPKLDRQVALKVPNPNSLASPEARDRFRREAHAAAILSHPGIVAVYESGEIGPLQFIVYKYCPGLTLSQWLKQNKLLHQPDIAARIAKQIAESVQHAHQKGVIHRDLKPSNILLEAENDGVITPDAIPGSLRISDFGLAKLVDDRMSLTQTEAVIGTPAYMSPEQAEGNATVDELSDVYSIGAIFYELLTGQPPHRKETIAATLRAITDEPIVSPKSKNPRIAKDLNAICLRCLERDPKDRYASAHALGQDLEAFLDHRQISISHPNLFQHIAKWCRRNQELTTVLAAATVFSLVVSLAAIFWINQARQNAENAKNELQQSNLDTQFQAGFAQRLLGRQLGFAANSKLALQENQKAIDVLKPLSESTRDPNHQQEYLTCLVDRIEILIQSGEIEAAKQIANQTNSYIKNIPLLAIRSLEPARLIYLSAWCNEISEDFESAENQFLRALNMLKDSTNYNESSKKELRTRIHNHLVYLKQMTADDQVDLQQLQDNLEAVLEVVKLNRAIFYYFEDESIAYESLARHYMNSENWPLAMQNLQWSIARMQRVENTTGTQLPFRHKRTGKMYHDLALCLERTGNSKLALDYLHRGIGHTKYALKNLPNDDGVRQIMFEHVEALIPLEDESKVQSLLLELSEIRHFATESKKLSNSIE